MIDTKGISVSFNKFVESVDMLCSPTKVEVLVILITEDAEAAVIHQCDQELAMLMLKDALEKYGSSGAIFIPKQDN